MMVTGEYHKKTFLMALYTCLHVNSFTLKLTMLCLHNGNRNTDTGVGVRGYMRPDDTLNGLMILHGPLQGTAPPLTLPCL